MGTVGLPCTTAAPQSSPSQQPFESNDLKKPSPRPRGGARAWRARGARPGAGWRVTRLATRRRPRPGILLAPLFLEIESGTIPRSRGRLHLFQARSITNATRRSQFRWSGRVGKLMLGSREGVTKLTGSKVVQKGRIHAFEPLASIPTQHEPLLGVILFVCPLWVVKSHKVEPVEGEAGICRPQHNRTRSRRLVRSRYLGSFKMVYRRVFLVEIEPSREVPACPARVDVEAPAVEEEVVRAFVENYLGPLHLPES